MPKEQEWWNAFLQTGRVEDYLRYKGIDVYQNQGLSSAEGGSVHADNDRRSDHPGKQQYR